MNARAHLRRFGLAFRLGLSLPAALALLAALTLALVPLPARATDLESRGRIGIKLLRQMMTADLDLESRALEDGQLLVLVVFDRNRGWAEELREVFRSGDSSITLKGMPVRLELASISEIPDMSAQRPAAIFVAEDLGPRLLDSLIEIAIRHRTLLYSPFEGHVERGAAGGLAIEAQVRPYVNVAALEASKIHLKELFLRVSKVYGDG